MFIRLTSLLFLLLCVGCGTIGTKPTIRVAASVVADGSVDYSELRLVEISSDTKIRKKQFSCFAESLWISDTQSESPTLVVKMTFCRTHPYSLPEVGGPGATSTSSLKVRLMKKGGAELVVGGSEKPPTQQAASTDAGVAPNRLSTKAVDHLEQCYKSITYNAG